MEKIVLKAPARPNDLSVKDLRVSGKVPGNVYGNVDSNILVCMDEVELKKTYIKAGESTLVQLDCDGKMVPVLFHSVDFDPVSDRMIHIDFYAVNMKEEVEADVHIRFDGESQIIKDGGILVTAMHEVTVKALPANLPHDLAVDLAKLTEFGATITVADIVVPDGVTIINDPEEVIAIAQEPREEEPEEVPVVVAEGAEGAAAEGAAPAEGEAAAEGEKKGE
jgi:large subunit ribosomal protein L25